MTPLKHLTVMTTSKHQAHPKHQNKGKNYSPFICTPPQEAKGITRHRKKRAKYQITTPHHYSPFLAKKLTNNHKISREKLKNRGSRAYEKLCYTPKALKALKHAGHSPRNKYKRNNQTISDVRTGICFSSNICIDILIH